MKTFLKIFILLSISNYSFSQIYYSHYLDATSEWKELTKDNTAGDHAFKYSTKFFEGTQNINGFTYYKMYKTGIIKRYTGLDYFPYFTSNLDTYFLGYVREDASGKFYFRDTAGTETVYFDNQLVLNAQLGNLFSTVGIYNYGSTTTTYLTCEIEAISTLNFGGLNLKTLKSGANFPTDVKIVEGIGTIFPFCESPQYLDLGTAGYNNDKSRIVCYTKQGQTTQIGDSSYWIFDTNVICSSFPNADRQAALNTVVFNKNAIQIYPNPTNNILNIQTINNENIIFIKIYNTLGKEILSKSNPSTKINVENLKSGTYFIKIKTDSNEINSKFIKQ